MVQKRYSRNIYALKIEAKGDVATSNVHTAIAEQLDLSQRLTFPVHLPQNSESASRDTVG